MESQKLKYSKQESLEACGVYLRQILDGLQSQNLAMTNGDGQIRQHPSGPVRFKLKAKQKGNEEQVTVELSWIRPDELPLLAAGNGIDGVEPKLQCESALDSSPGDGSGAPTQASRSDAYVKPNDLKIAKRWMTREKLYELAGEYDVAGRSQMSKDELVVALASAGINPLDDLRQKDLYAIAREAEIEGRSNMTQPELVDALRAAIDDAVYA